MSTSVLEIYEGQEAVIRNKLPQLRRVREYDGRFEVSDIEEVTIDPPELFMTNLGGPINPKSKTIVDHSDSWAFIVAAKQAGLVSNVTHSAPHIASEICLFLQFQTWGIDDDDIEFPEEINSVPIYQTKDGIFLWTITFKQAFRTGPGNGAGIAIGND